LRYHGCVAGRLNRSGRITDPHELTFRFPLASFAAFIMHGLIHDIALSIMAAWLLGVLAYLARQPAILAYLVAGFAVGPAGLKLVHAEESIHVIGEVGLILLLFMIGLEIDLKKIVRAGRVILVSAGVQIAAGSLLGVAFFLLIGMPIGSGRWDALYLGVGAALSSTVIIVKVLYDKHELDTLPGRITLGILVLQDLFVILFLAIQPNLNNLHLGIGLLSAARVAVLIAAALLISRFVLPWLFHRIARLPELVVVGALAWCFLVGEIAVLLSLSREMGALVAGVALSTFPYALDVTAKVTSLRDFFVTLFFVALGMALPIPDGAMITSGLVLAAFAVISRVATTFIPLYLLKQGLRASLLPAINLAQLSEFTLVLLQLGVQAGHLSAGTASSASFAFVLLAALSTFAMMRSDALSRVAIAGLKQFGLRDLDQTSEPEAESGGAHHGSRIMLLGFYRTASSLLAEFERQNVPIEDQISVVDFNPGVYHSLRARGVKVVYGDIGHADVLKHAGIADAQIVISSVPDALLVGTSNARLVRSVRAINPTAKIIATADVIGNVQVLYDAGADHVVMSRFVEANALLDAIRAAEEGLLQDRRAELDAQLEGRREVLP
jgi:Kef-type K+ transport system membrane component KefB